jgi:hypothetical protein
MARVAKRKQLVFPERPRKLTREIIETICTHLAKGNMMDTCAAMAGVLRPTFSGWMREGRALIESDTEPANDHQRMLIKLVEAVSYASAKAETTDLANMERCGEGDWKYYAEKMKRRYKAWGDKKTVNKNVNHTGGVEHSHQHLHALISQMDALPVETVMQIKQLLANAETVVHE